MYKAKFQPILQRIPVENMVRLTTCKTISEDDAPPTKLSDLNDGEDVIFECKVTELSYGHNDISKAAIEATVNYYEKM